jgi:hypothetical protein
VSGFDVEQLRFAWEILVTIFSVGGAVACMWASLNFVKRAHFDAREAAWSDRFEELEGKLDGVVRHEDLQSLTRSVGDLTSRVADMEGQTKRNNRLLEAIHEHLLNRSD